MKGCFLKAGKYKIGVESIVVSEVEVKAETEFDVNSDKAAYFIEAGCFIAGKRLPAAPNPEDFNLENLSANKVDQLKAYAAEKEIDLGDVTKKDDIIEAIQLALEPAAPNPEDFGKDD